METLLLLGAVRVGARIIATVLVLVLFLVIPVLLLLLLRRVTSAGVTLCDPFARPALATGR